MKNLQELAKAIIEDPGYKASVIARAQAGTLDPMVEMAIIELAEGRTPLSGDHGELTSPHQSRTLALVRPSAFKEAE